LCETIMPDTPLTLTHGDWHLVLAPALGGSILALDWRGQPVMRRGGGGSIWDVASYPLVPFSNRIAHGRFVADGRAVALAPNFPGSDHPHTIHGFGWLAPWHVAQAGPGHARLTYAHSADAWPWPFAATQDFAFAQDALVLTLSLTNQGDSPMPAGLGIHPYFPRGADTVYHGLHRGEWHNTPDCLPLSLDQRDQAIDWWQGAPVGSRTVDTAYTGRQGPITLRWADRGLGLTMTPSDTLGQTVVYTPAGEDYVCVEPVSHTTDAVNRDRAGETGLVWLAPGETMTASITFAAWVA
jgi:aldose 1-epimerase